MDNHKKWLKYALDDLSWTEANLKEQVWYGACFTAQQAAEKALKAYLITSDSNGQVGLWLGNWGIYSAYFDAFRLQVIH